MNFMILRESIRKWRGGGRRECRVKSKNITCSGSNYGYNNCMPKESNIAFIDGQNLHFGTQEDNWSVDFGKFRTYLQDKYNVTEAYYFLGYVSDEQQDLYNNLQKASFIVSFKEHSSNLAGKKKGQCRRFDSALRDSKTRRRRYWPTPHT